MTLRWNNALITQTNRNPSCHFSEAIIYNIPIKAIKSLAPVYKVPAILLSHRGTKNVSQVLKRNNSISSLIMESLSTRCVQELVTWQWQGKLGKLCGPRSSNNPMSGHFTSSPSLFTWPSEVGAPMAHYPQIIKLNECNWSIACSNNILVSQVVRPLVVFMITWCPKKAKQQTTHTKMSLAVQWVGEAGWISELSCDRWVCLRNQRSPQELSGVYSSGDVIFIAPCKS